MPDNSGQTPLHAAVIASNVKVVESLIDLGANVIAQDNERHSPAHWAVGRYIHLARLVTITDLPAVFTII